MKLREVIASLQKMQGEHGGDLPVVVWDTTDNENTTDLCCFSILENDKGKAVHLLLADQETGSSFS